MNLLTLIGIPALVTIIVIVSVLLIGAIITLYLLVIRNKRLNHSIIELTKRYEYTHVLLFEDDESHIKRLENISQVNLLYADTYQQYLARFIPLKTDYDLKVKNAVGELREFYNTGKYSLARKNYSEAKNLLVHYENLVNALNDDLLKISSTETELKTKEINAKEKVNAIKEKQDAFKVELAMMKNTYAAIYQHLDSLFEKFDSYLDGANYDESALILNQINKVIAEFDNANKEMPTLCVKATKIIPQKISDMKFELKRMQVEGCPTYNIVNDKIIKEIEDSLEKVTNNLKRFSYKNASHNLDIIERNIDTIFKAFEEERSAKKTFESISDGVDKDARKYQNEFIRLCSVVHEIKKYYIITDEREQQLKKVSNLIDRLAVAKRSFDDLCHQQVKSPYSILLNRINILKEENADVSNELANFRQYLSSLKVDVENAHSLLSTTYYHIKKIEKLMRDAAIQSINDKYSEKIDAIYDALDEISIKSNSLPINVEEINKRVNFIKFDGESCFNQIEQDINMMRLAESAIVYANRGRNTSNEINAAIAKGVKYFNEGEYERAYNEVSECVKQYNEGETIKKKHI